MEPIHHMSDDSSSTLKKGEALVASWLSATEALTQRLGAPPRVQDTPGPLVLALSLTHIPVKSVVSELKGASEEVVKAHKGVRTTIAIVKVLSPGFSSVSAEGDGGSKGGKGAPGKKGGGGDAREVKEKLATVNGEDLRMHSYDLVNKKGTYQRSGRTAAYARVSPGMVFSLNVWGSKVVQTFKGQDEDLQPFSFVVVQLSMKGINSTAASSGHMLEIKTMQASAGLSMAATRLLRYDAFPGSVLASSAANAPAEGGAAAETPENEDQALIKSNFASSVHFIATRPGTNNGVFAVGPDGRLNFHISEPLSDIPANAISVRFDPETMGVSPGHEEWVAKFFNIAIMLKAVEIFVVMDNYRCKDIAPADLILEGFARVDVSAVIRHVLAVKGAAIVDPEADSFLTQSMPATSLKHVVIYQGLIPDLDLAIDVRYMTKKVGALVVDAPGSSSQSEPTTTLVHSDARWQRAHFMHFYHHQKPVLTVMLPSLASVGNAVERAKRALQPVALVHHIEGACFEEEEEEAPAAALAPAQKKKSKTAA